VKIAVVSKAGEGSFVADMFPGQDVRFAFMEADPETLPWVPRIVNLTEATLWGPEAVISTSGLRETMESCRNAGLRAIGSYQASTLLEFPVSDIAKKNLESWKVLCDPKAQGETLTCGAWFEKTDWVLPYFYADVQDFFMPHRMGAYTGYEGHVAWSGFNPKEKLFSRTLKKLKMFLAGVNYIGPVTASFVVKEDDKMAYLTALSLSVPHFFRLFHGCLASPHQLLNYPKEDGLDLVDGFFAQVRVSLPPYPLMATGPVRKEVMAQNCTGVKFKPRFDVLEDVVKDGEEWVCAGTSGSLGYSIGYGPTPQDAVSVIAEKLSCTHTTKPWVNQQARMDIGQNTSAKMKKLLSWGYGEPADVKREVAACL
jgi:hypothetical protein